MCGLTAIITKTPHSAHHQALREMHETLFHRGPDGEGYLGFNIQTETYSHGPSLEPSHFYLAHRRLSIIDLSSAANQPMTLHGISLIFNGEIYNYKELRTELESQGYTFQTQSDTEVLLQAYRFWGNDALHHLIGMFAFILLDQPRQTLLIARDPFGIKPLYWRQEKESFYFSSEIPPLLKNHTPKVSQPNLWTYLRTGITDHETKTLFEGIQSFPAGHWASMTFENLSWEPKPYWTPNLDTQEISYDQAVSQVRNLFMESVSLHLRSDVAYTTALSGGLDSSCLTFATRQLLGPQTPLTVFGYCAPHFHQNEESWIEKVALETKSHLIKVHTASPSDLPQEMMTLIKAQGEPFGSPSIYAQYKVFQAAHEKGFKVILTGQGADEAFGGYAPYVARALARTLLQGKATDFLTLLKGASRSLPLSRLLSQTLLKILPFPLYEILMNQWRGTSSWIKESYFQDHTPSDPFKNGPSRSLKEDLAESLKTTVLPALLRYDDRNSMHHSLESRVPFLTTPLVDFAYSLPDSYFISPKGQTKCLLRDALRDLVPSEILDRKDKVSFATPEKEILTQLWPSLQKTLKTDSYQKIPFLPDSSQMEILLEQWLKKGHYRQVWRVYNFLQWASLFEVTYE